MCLLSFSWYRSRIPASPFMASHFYYWTSCVFVLLSLKLYEQHQMLSWWQADYTLLRS
jgi:hypothetical protein